MIACIVAAIPVLIYISWSLLQMEIRYRKAASSGIPLIRMPIDPLNPVWLIVGPLIWDVLDQLPFNYGTFKYTRRGWPFFDKADSFLKYGPIWGLVSPVDVYLHVADADAIQSIYSRRLDFIRPTWLYTVLDIYGPCISTANSVNWPKHRKLVASPFTESFIASVWDETAKQSQEVVQSWTSSGCNSYSKDIRGLCLNVLAAAGFQRPLDFKGAAISKEHGINLQGYRNALEMVLDNSIWLMVFPYQYLTSQWLPRSWRAIGNAALEFKRYMEIMLDQAFQAEKRGNGSGRTIMSAFVRALDAPASGKSMSIDEIFGNIFAVNFAGYDPTANTISFVLLLLAIHPHVQDWIGEEIEETFPDTTIPFSYNQYSKLIRCQAVLLETLRLYPSHPLIPKWTNDRPQPLRVSGKDYIIPAHTGLMLGTLATQTMPQHWPDAMQWQPKRWIVSSDKPRSTSGSTARESLIEPKPMTYIAWSNGPQHCPAEKFTKIEVVATLAAMFREHRVRVLPEPGETEEQTVMRAQGTLDYCESILNTRMRNAHKIRLQWTKVA